MASPMNFGPEQPAGERQPHTTAPDRTDTAPELKSVLSTAELSRRPLRPADHEGENYALIALAQELATSPHGILRKLAETAMALCHAHSAGISLLNDDEQSFHWPVIVGQWASHQGGGTPRGYGPCGTVLDRNVALLFSHPERDFSYFAPVTPLIEEALLIPFYIEGKAVGTIWIIAHDYSRRFDLNDLRVMNNLGTFAAAAYQTLLSLSTSQRKEQELRDFLENASISMHWVGPDGVILWANRAEMEMLGVTHDEYIGHHIAEFHVDQSVIDDILRRLTTGETLNNCEARLRCKDSSIRHVLINSNVLRDGDKFVHTRCFTRDVTDRKQAEERIQLLARETDHRAKNVLSLVQATVHLTKAETAEDVKSAISGRIQAIANAHALFAQSRWEGADLRTLITAELAPYCQRQESRADVKGPELILEPTTAQSMAVALHELTTNAVKYGALSVDTGRLQLEWSHHSEGKFIFRWSETGGPPVKPPTRQGFGTRAIEQMIRQQMKGKIRFDWSGEGLVCEIAIPKLPTGIAEPQASRSA